MKITSKTIQKRRGCSPGKSKTSHEDLLAVIEDPSKSQAQEVIGILVEYAAQLKDFNLKYKAADTGTNKKMEVSPSLLDQRMEKLWEDREKCIRRLEILKDKKEKLQVLLKELKPISKKVNRLCRVAKEDEEFAQCLRMVVASNWVILQDLILEGHRTNPKLLLNTVSDVVDENLREKQKLLLCWQETYLGDGVLDMTVLENETPESSDNQWVPLDAKEARGCDSLTDLAGNGEVEFAAINSATDICDTCGWRIGFSDPRWRCTVCLQTQCDSCHRHFCENFHGQHIDKVQNGKLGMVLEKIHPSMARLEASSCQSLAEAMYTILDKWGDRPAFCVYPDKGRHPSWLSYRQVLNAALKRVTKLRELQCNQVALCFPAASIDFYLWDIACIMAGIITIGIPCPPPAVEDWPDSVGCVVCSGATQKRYNDRIPSKACWIDASSADDLAPFDASRLVQRNKPDPEDSICTIFFTSGTTGKPKLVPETRRRFKDDNFNSSFVRGRLECSVSFLPPCWGTDRHIIYWSVAFGNRVGFAPQSPTMPQLVEAMEMYKPTWMVIPPTVAQFLCSLGGGDNQPPSLGGNIEFLSVGGGPTSQGMLRGLRDIYGIKDVREGYGSTEVGGIASNGWFHLDILKSVRIRDPNHPSDQEGGWLDKRKEGVVGELWIGDINTSDIVEVTSWGQHVRVIGRSKDAGTFKLENGKWCALIDIEDEITRSCCPELFDEVMVWVNHKGTLVMLGSRAAPRWGSAGADRKSLLQETIKRTNLNHEKRPKALLLTNEPLPKTVTLKVQRGKVIQQFQQVANSLELNSPSLSEDNEDVPAQDVADIAALVLGGPVDSSKSFMENGGDSMTAVLWFKEIERRLGKEAVSDWRALLDNPLECQGAPIDKTEEEEVTVEPPAAVDSTADSILLTGATGFFGKHVLQAILRKHEDVVVVCLVREASVSAIEASRRVLVVTSVPKERKYWYVIHLAANVNHVLGYRALKADNVDMTEYLLRLRVAPMIYCSSMSTREGTAPFPDGYTQSKWVSEQMVLRSGGKCFWPPLLVWGNRRDWLTRLLQHSLRTGYYPSDLGFVVACPVDVAARDLVEGRPCSAWDLDLSELFLRLRVETGTLQPLPLTSFVEELQKDQESPAYPILPLLRGKAMVGNTRTRSLQPLEIDAKLVLSSLHG
ncbi:Domain-containing protein [Seminavis robusta]|uniref:Domain-containing protein n=1 Tax=Seminavis robusta TaxID=568900 RepID=A0A9N8H809_9STRA|nr:Domain-containing protein [Seminavis robusta]|eukprot:Sro145_g067230.1 Domain-containing protein (1169) ;mRNA; f:29548-33054